MLKLGRNARYSFLLESVEGGAVRGRYSIIGLNPDVIWKAVGTKAFINRKALGQPMAPSRNKHRPPRIAPGPQYRELHQASRGRSAHGSGRVRLSRLDSVRPDGAPARYTARRARLPDGIMIRPT